MYRNQQLADIHAPLADRMRPQSLSEFVGQKELLGEGKLFRKLVESGQAPSMIFWGPPGCGKTTLARLIATHADAEFVQLSAVESGKKELMDIIEKAKQTHRLGGRTMLFVDEIHRWSKTQQDALLKAVEQGIVTCIGATTENPSFEIVGALLSRCRVFVLSVLSSEDIMEVVHRALVDTEHGLGTFHVHIDDDALQSLAQFSGGDARMALNGLDLAVKAKSVGGEKDIQLQITDIHEALSRTHLVFDKNGEEFYNLISALHKSMRGGDADAALYWLARMLEGGADPLYVARRVVRFASEDIGLANNTALLLAQAAFAACHTIGMPECAVHLAHAVVYCAKSEKSNVIYKAYGEAAMDARNTSHLGVPLHIRNAPTALMKELDYGKGYKYNPDYDGLVEQEYLPKELLGKKYVEIKKARNKE